MRAPSSRPASPHAHAVAAFRAVRVGIVTISDTRSPATDASGDALDSIFRAAGHRVASRVLVRDDPDAIVAAVVAAITVDEAEVVVTTGGTGFAARDSTIEALEPRFDRRVPGFGELFRSLSFQEIGAAAMLSRATAGTMAGAFVACLPGSPSAVQLGATRLLVPELIHLADLAKSVRFSTK